MGFGVKDSEFKGLGLGLRVEGSRVEGWGLRFEG